MVQIKLRKLSLQYCNGIGKVICCLKKKGLEDTVILSKKKIIPKQI
jgi:hypothetical protein